MGHQAQFAVEVGDIDADFALAFVVQRHRGALQGDDGYAGVRAFAAFGQRRVATKCQTGQAPLAGFNQLAVDVELVDAIGFAAKQAGVRIGRWKFGDIEDAHVHCRKQYVHLLRHTAIGVFGGDLYRQRLFGAHFFRCSEGQAEFALGAIQRQVQQAHGAFRRDIGFALAGTNHQGAHIQIVARPFRVELHRKAFAFGRHVDFLPPQRAFGRLHQQVAFTGSRWRDGDVGGVAIAIGGFVQR